MRKPFTKMNPVYTISNLQTFSCVFNIYKEPDQLTRNSMCILRSVWSRESQLNVYNIKRLSKEKKTLSELFNDNIGVRHCSDKDTSEEELRHCQSPSCTCLSSPLVLHSKLQFKQYFSIFNYTIHLIPPNATRIKQTSTYLSVCNN